MPAFRLDRGVAFSAAIILLVLAFSVRPVFGQADISDVKIELTPEEQAFLERHAPIHIGIMNNWPPMDFVDKAGKPRGIGVDYVEVLNERLGGVLVIEPAPFAENYEKVKDRQLDALMDITPQPEREPFFFFTRPYVSIPHVIVGRKEGPYFASENDLKGRTVALEKGYYNIIYFQTDYPDVKLKEYNSTGAALKAVARGEADAYAGNRAVVVHLIDKERIRGLHLQGWLRKPPVDLTIGVRKDWPELMPILDKGLASISEAERYAILEKWTLIRQTTGFDYGLLWRLLAVVAVIIAFIVYWNRRLAVEVARRVQKERELQKYLQLQVERMPIGLIVWDRDFRVKSWNPAAERIFGFSEKEAMGKHPYDLIVPGEAQPQVNKIWSRLLEGDETAHSLNENITKDGRTITCSWANTPLKQADGEVIGALSMLQDVTERSKWERELKERISELEIFHRSAAGRELKMMDLEKEVNSLLKELGREPKYKGG